MVRAFAFTHDGCFAQDLGFKPAASMGEQAVSSGRQISHAVIGAAYAVVVAGRPLKERIPGCQCFYIWLWHAIQVLDSDSHWFLVILIMVRWFTLVVCGLDSGCSCCWAEELCGPEKGCVIKKVQCV
jgi:hypothetical protein